MSAKETRRESDLAAINDVYERWCRAWRTLDSKLMVSLFDQDSEGLLYQSEENPSGLFKYSEVVAYWENALNILDKVTEWRELVKRVALVGSDAAWIWAEMMTGLTAKIFPQELGGKIRCSIGLRRTNGSWKIVHYHESRQLLMNPGADGVWTFLPDVTLK
ncbi:MAG: nuclear transport factor 2 family protein [Armatimonadota bacterium]|nr:nuclear transport factor 2 family protein [Armatimonadota bacterium]